MKRLMVSSIPAVSNTTYHDQNLICMCVCLCGDKKVTGPFTGPPGPYVLYDAHTMVIIALYVDNLVLASNHLERLQRIKALLQGKFEMKNLGSLSFGLRVQIKRNQAARTLTVLQAKYTQEILKRFNMSTTWPISTPLAARAKLSSEDQPKN